MGYLRGLMHGTVIGTIAGLCIAPKPGKQTRDQLAKMGRSAKGTYEAAERTVLRTVDKLTPPATRGQSAHDTADEPNGFTPEPSVHIHEHHNGSH